MSGVGVNRISQEKDLQIRFLLAQGVSHREIGRRVGVAHQTVSLRSRQPVVDEPVRRASFDQCDFCGKLVGHKEFHRRTRRTKHKFCCHGCYCDFYMYLRRKDRCTRCGICRYEMFFKNFTRGMCPRCYCVMREYGFDENAAELHDLTQELKAELRNAERVDGPKHVRSAEATA